MTNSTPLLSVRAYAGDAKTLLAFDLLDTTDANNFAGFTIECRATGQQSYYLYNSLQFRTPGDHAQDANEPAYSSINAPFHKFRWLHIPGSAHQGLKPFLGEYSYTVTARYFDDHHSLLPLDAARGVSVNVDVVPFQKKGLGLGFTRGFTQSQAFVRHFGLKALIRPAGEALIFDTAQVAGIDARGKRYTFADEYEWSGFTARERIFALLDEVVNDTTLRLDVFAYDLNEPDLIEILLQLAGQVESESFSTTRACTTPPQSPNPKMSSRRSSNSERQERLRFSEATSADTPTTRSSLSPGAPVQ